MDFMSVMKEREAAWVIYWVYLLAAVKMSSLFFYKERVAQIIIAMFILSSISLNLLFQYYGYGKFLGLAHFWWFICYIYAIKKYKDTEGKFKIYLDVYFIIIGLSLVMDVLDVGKFLLGG